MKRYVTEEQGLQRSANDLIYYETTQSSTEYFLSQAKSLKEGGKKVQISKV